ncbi:hypothetical protein [Salinarimonas rosea]|uniref:hypothetical protein n=1 Tax=Salinarimonas rosea TaxID=552063 RepID=UPI001FDAB473|nr:hypothetical protein [Salinarimonas rosea]
MARGVVFRGLGPATLAATGVLALLVAAGQALVLGGAPAAPLAYFLPWILTAGIAAALILAEAVTRSRRIHSDLADDLIRAAIEQFLPVAAAGALIGLVLARVAPETLWLLPGLWQVLVGLGVFGAARLLPRGLALAGAWYVLAGLATLALGASTEALSPWLMGVPFGAGQLLVAAILQFAPGETDAG